MPLLITGGTYTRDILEIVSELKPHVSIRGCMVKVNDNLVRLGGSQSIYDHLNVGTVHDYIKSAKIINVDNDKVKLEDSFQGICGTSYTGYMQHCLALVGPDATIDQIHANNVTDFMILSVGGGLGLVFILIM